MKTGKIGTRYSKAFFDLALEQGVLEETRNDMALVAAVIEENRELQRMLESPVINAPKKAAILESIFKPHCQSLSLDFLLLLTRNEREDFLFEIARYFEVLYRKYKKIITVKLVTASPVSDEIRAEIKNLILQHMEGSVELEEKVDPELIGGFILNFEDRKYDASIAQELEKLKKEFNINLYVREI